MILTKTLVLALLTLQEQGGTKAPDPRDQKIQWLEKKVELLEAKVRGLLQFYGADEQLMQLEQTKPTAK